MRDKRRINDFMLAHFIIDYGLIEIRSWTDEDIEHSGKILKAQEERAIQERKIPIFTAEYQIAMMKEAKQAVEDGTHMKIIAKGMAESTYINQRG